MSSQYDNYVPNTNEGRRLDAFKVLLFGQKKEARRQVTNMSSANYLLNSERHKCLDQEGS